MPFYAASDACFTIPGLDSGFVPQDLFHIEDEDIWLFSGYQANRKPSPLYRLSPDGTTAKLTIKLPDDHSTKVMEQLSPPRLNMDSLR